MLLGLINMRVMPGEDITGVAHCTDKSVCIAMRMASSQGLYHEPVFLARAAISLEAHSFSTCMHSL